jgi:hypothetical protein
MTCHEKDNAAMRESLDETSKQNDFASIDEELDALFSDDNQDDRIIRVLIESTKENNLSWIECTITGQHCARQGDALYVVSNSQVSCKDLITSGVKLITTCKVSLFEDLRNEIAVNIFARRTGKCNIASKQSLIGLAKDIHRANAKGKA